MPQARCVAVFYISAYGSNMYMLLSSLDYIMVTIEISRQQMPWAAWLFVTITDHMMMTGIM